MVGNERVDILHLYSCLLSIGFELLYDMIYIMTLDSIMIDFQCFFSQTLVE